jgi:hypothetical protein
MQTTNKGVDSLREQEDLDHNQKQTQVIVEAQEKERAIRSGYECVLQEKTQLNMMVVKTEEEKRALVSFPYPPLQAFLLVLSLWFDSGMLMSGSGNPTRETSGTV